MLSRRKIQRNIGEGSTSTDSESSWDDLRDMGLKKVEISTKENIETKKVSNAERQQNKIKLFLLSNDYDVLSQHNVKITPEQEEDFERKMREGKISEDSQRAMLEGIMTPIHFAGAENVYDRMKGDKHQRRILATMVGRGFENYDATKANDLGVFLQTFSNPMDFEDAERGFMESIRRANTPKKYLEYMGAMNDFKRNIYGKRQEYWEQMKALRGEFPEERQGIADVLGLAVDSLRRATGNRKSGLNADNKEVEHSGVHGGVAAVSKGELIGGRDNVSEDAYVLNPEKGVLAVFDGVGGSEGGHEASKLAANTLMAEIERFGLEGDDLPQMMVDINKRLCSARNEGNKIGYTTATIAKIDDTAGRKILTVASIGDSRLYLVRGEKIKQLTSDDNFTEEMLNQIGVINPEMRRRYLEHGISKSLGTQDMEQTKCSKGNFAKYLVLPGDKIMLCSDGITGDTAEDIMLEEEILNILSQKKSDDGLASDLVGRAKKEDDRTAIVYTI